MRLSTLIISAFSLYSLMGICPMQMSMIMTADSDMAMMHNGAMNMGDMQDSSSEKGCSDCEDSVDHFMLKESTHPITTVVSVLPVSIDTTIVFRPLENISPVANTGPRILASDIVEHIVYRT